MKGLVFFLLPLPLLGAAHADPISDTIQSASKAYGSHVVATMWKSRCSRPDALRLYANCYVNPEGVALWQVTGPEKEKWKPTAIQESVRLQKEHRGQVEIAKEEGQRAAQKNQMNSQMCNFWKQQTESERRNQKISQYCTK